MKRAIIFALSIMLGAGFAAALVPASAQQPVTACPERLVGTPSLVCSCTAEATQAGSVWGSDLYTDDSAICRAALHAGMIEASGGTVWVFERPGSQTYPAVDPQRVTSITWTGGWRRSIAFRPASEASSVAAGTGVAACPATAAALAEARRSPAPARSRRWPPARSGATDPIPATARICRSALHTGAVGAYGGNVNVRIEAGRASYPAATRNGVEGAAWASYATTLTFER